MSHWITSSRLENGERCHPLDDIVYLPKPLQDGEASRVVGKMSAMRDDGRLAAMLPADIRPCAANLTPEQVVFWLCRGYVDAMQKTGVEPSWIESAPAGIRRHLRQEWEQLDPVPPSFMIVPSFPYTGIAYRVVENGLIESAFHTFGLNRLMHVRQLAYLHEPLIRNLDGSSFYGAPYSHVRWNHVMDVTAVATLMAQNNGLTPEDRATLRLAAITHDALTPAGGDTVKNIDPAAFDEDLHYPELLASCDWDEIRTEYAIDPGRLIATVQGNGILGSLLDIADKVSYVSRDAWHYVRIFGDSSPGNNSDGSFPIRQIVERSPHVCNIWDIVRVVGGNVVFTDGDRLAEFLRLRVLLFRQMYMHEGSRFLEFLVGKVIVRWMYSTGRLSRQDLLRMDDDELDALLEKAIGVKRFSWTPRRLGQPRVRSFASKDEAIAFAHEMHERGTTFVFLEDMDGKIKPSTKYLVQAPDGRIAPFADAYPETTAQLHELSKLDRPFRVFSIEQDDLSPTVIEAYRAFQLQTQPPPAADP